MNYKRINNEGMTLPELILAVLMLTAFTGITVMVTAYTSRFFQPLNEEAREEYISSNKELNDKLNDHNKINKALDSVIEILSQPGIDRNFILNLECTSLPSLEWNIPSIDTEAIPKSYKICIKPTSLSESNYSTLANDEGKPGISILYSKPENGVSINSIELFCISSERSFMKSETFINCSRVWIDASVPCRMTFRNCCVRILNSFNPSSGLNFRN